MKIVVLDRDGVINIDSDDYIKSEDEWAPIPGSIDAIARLSHAGFLVVVATNQSGLARGLFSEFDLARMHQKLQNMVIDAGGKIDGVFYCPHSPTDKCSCRKPATGLLTQIEEEFLCSLQNAPFVGDSVKDIEAATAHGCKPILVKTGKGLQSLNSLQETKHCDFDVYTDLSEAVDSLLATDHD